MFNLAYKPSFYMDLEKTVKDRLIRRQIVRKTLELEKRAPLGKKLKNNPCWSIHVGGYRIIYEMTGTTISLLRILDRKHDYRDL